MENNCLRNKLLSEQRGITLVALVVTIIVLLILAGVSLSVVTGSNGILGKAQKSIDINKAESAKEQVELKIAEFQTEFYEKVYVNHEEDVNKKMGDWIAKNKKGDIETEDYKFAITGDTAPYTVTINKNKNLKEEIVGTLTKEGKLSWEELTVSDLTVNNYGDYVDLKTEYVKEKELGNGVATEDWRVFYKDDTGVYLVLADFLPYSYENNETEGSSIGLQTGLGGYGASDDSCTWISTISKDDFLDKLNNSNTWNRLLSNTYINKGITVKGTLDFETWVSSRNDKGHTRLYTKADENGYYIGKEPNPTGYVYSESSETEDILDLLYFPHKNGSTACFYWLASYSNNIVVVVEYGKNVDDKYDFAVGAIDYDSIKGELTETAEIPEDFDFGIRPVVHVPSNIKIKKDSNGVWQINE